MSTPSAEIGESAVTEAPGARDARPCEAGLSSLGREGEPAAGGFEVRDVVARQALRAHLGARAARSAAWRGGANVGAALVRVGVLAVLARRLPPSAFGVVAMSAAVTGFATAVAELGLGSAIVQRPRLTSAQLWWVFRVNLSLSLALWACCAAAAPWVGRFFHEPQAAAVLLVSAAMLPISALAVVPWALLVRYLEFNKLAICELADVIVNGGVSIAMAMTGMGVWSLVAGSLAGMCVSTTLMLMFSPWRPAPAGGAGERAALVRFGAAVALIALAFYWTDRVANVLVGRLLGSSSLGLYVVAFNLAIVTAGQVSGVTRMVAFPAFSALQGNRTRLAGAYQRCVRWSAALALPFCAVMAVVAPQLILVFLGPKWAAAVTPFRLLLAVGAMRSLYGFAALVLRAVGRPQIELLIQSFFCAGIAMSVAVGARGGINGVAAGVAGFVCLVGGPLFITVAARVSGVGLIEVLRCAGGPAAAAGVAGVVAFAAGRVAAGAWPEAPGFVLLASGAGAGLLAYGVALRAIAGDLFGEARSRLVEALRRERAPAVVCGVSAGLGPAVPNTESQS